MKRIARHRPRKSTFSQTLCHFVPFVAFIKLNSKIHHNTDRSLDYIVIIERYSLSHSSSSIVTCALRVCTPSWTRAWYREREARQRIEFGGLAEEKTGDIIREYPARSKPRVKDVLLLERGSLTKKNREACSAIPRKYSRFRNARIVEYSFFPVFPLPLCSFPTCSPFHLYFRRSSTSRIRKLRQSCRR